MHLSDSSGINRSHLLIATKRVLAATVGAVGVLVLSGSQSFLPVAAAYLTPSATPKAYSAAGAFPATGPTPIAGPTTPLLVPTPPAAAATTPPAVDTPTQPYGLTTPAGLTASGIPQAAYSAYVAAANQLATSDPTCKLSWTVIAGIGRVESNHGRFGGSSIGADGVVSPPILGVRLDGSRAGTARISDTDNGKYDGDTAFDRAVGPMQFLPGTWKIYGAGANPQNITAAALATGRYLCVGNSELGTKKGRWAAVYRYNHSDSYVSLVLSLADSYATGTPAGFTNPPGGATPPTTTPPATTPGPPPAVPTPPKATPTPTPSRTLVPRPTIKPPTPTTTTAPPTTAPTTTTPPTTAPTTAPPTTDPVPTTTPPAAPTGAPTTTTEPPAPTTTSPSTAPTTSSQAASTTTPISAASPTCVAAASSAPATPTPTPPPTPTGSAGSKVRIAACDS